MSVNIAMPRLSDSMEEGTILRWLKSPGDSVELGEELVEIETDKANMVYEADAGGTLIAVIAQEGDTLPIGEVIARVAEAGEVVSDGGEGDDPAEEGDSTRERPSPVPGSAASQSPPVPAAEPLPATSPSSTSASAATAPTPQAPAPTGDGRVKASPLARRIASERGLDLAGLAGSGPGGRIVKAGGERGGRAGPPPGRRSGRRSGGAHSGRGGAAGDREGKRLVRGAQQAAVHGRPPHGRVEGDGAALLPLGRGRHEPRRRSPGAPEGGGGGGRAGALVQRHGGQGVRDRAARASARQRRLPGRPVRDLFACQRRRRSGRARRPRGAHGVRRRPEGPASDSDRDPGAGRARPRGNCDATGAFRRDVHGLQPRHVRDLELLRGDQPAPGGDPGGGRDRRAAGGERRRGDRRAPDGDDPGLRPPDPLRRGRRALPRPDPKSPRGATRTGALTLIHRRGSSYRSRFRRCWSTCSNPGRSPAPSPASDPPCRSTPWATGTGPCRGRNQGS